MNITIKREEVKEYMNLLTNKALLDIRSSKISYMVDKNLGKLESELKHQDKFQKKAFEERGKLSEEYLAAEKALLEKYSEKDAAGKPIIRDNRYELVQELAEQFTEERKALSETYPEDTAKQTTLNEKMEKYLAETVTISLHDIKEKDLPEDITPRQRLLIREFIID